MIEHLVEMARSIQQQSLDPNAWSEARLTLQALRDELGKLESKDFPPQVRAEFAKCKVAVQRSLGDPLGTNDTRRAMHELMLRLAVVLSQYSPELPAREHNPAVSNSAPKKSSESSLDMNLHAAEVSSAAKEERHQKRRKLKANLKDGTLDYETTSDGRLSQLKITKRTLGISVIVVAALTLSLVVKFSGTNVRTEHRPPAITANESISIYLNGLLTDGQTSTVGSVGYDRMMRRIEARTIGIVGPHNTTLQLTVAGVPVGNPFTISKDSAKASVDLSSTPIACPAGDDLGVRVIANGGAADVVVTVSSEVGAKRP